MIAARQDLHISLQKFFGFDSFKGDQEVIIHNLLDGNDTFVIMPTGAGKSLCYQLPALMMEGTAIIISPLIALMKNQVDSIRGYSDEDEVAHFLNSSLNRSQMKKVKQDIVDGKTKLLYIAPETLTKEENIEFLQGINLSFIAVDEAHCISEWGHDFRPEYRRIRDMIDHLNKNIPIIALTATATPKVREDIVKNLGMKAEDTFVSSFNRTNLFYDIRPKGKREQNVKTIIQIIKEEFLGKSGIIYVQNRKTAEELAQVLNVNGIKSSPYHAGLDAKTRTKAQDDFLMEDIEVICATIAFGMGIDKPDVRFVIHYDIPKSIENYYQETGRGGRDGLDGKCIAFYAYSDILKLEKFLRDKPVAEREMGALLLQEVEAYVETGGCRRQFLLHYFGEEFETKNCHGMCDNCRYPREVVDGSKDLVTALQSIADLNENYVVKNLLDFVIGNETKIMKDYKHNQLSLFGIGKEQGENYWASIFRQGMLQNYIGKNIEDYGLLFLTDKGKEFIKSPQPFMITLNHDYNKEIIDEDETEGKTAALDTNLVKILQDLRKQVSKKHNLPPYVIFTDPSLEDMATQYPISMDDMTKITGVSLGKAQKYGREFVKVIAQYVEDNEIERPMDFIVKSVANKSKTKVAIIHAIDKKVPLQEIARQNNMTQHELVEELEAIVFSGTKLNIDYYLIESIDEYNRETAYDYFKEAETEDLDIAFEELKDDDITYEEIQLMRLKFLSDYAN
jgi:ATP-dependent DNA helicase RecQ